MKNLRKYGPIATGILILLALYGVVGKSDADEQEVGAQYTAEIMKSAREQALTERRAEWTHLVEQGDQFTPPKTPVIALK